MRRLTLTSTFEYYDVPQIFTATDATGTRYLCTLYAQESDGVHYLGVQISEPRLMAFVGGQLDLRDAYLHPEVSDALYTVCVADEQLMAEPIPPTDISEEMLPEAGYFFDADDLADDADELQSDTYQLEVPVHDRVTFSTLISRMGWHASSIGKSFRKIVAL